MAVAYVSDVDHLSQTTGTTTDFTSFAVGATSNPVILVVTAWASATETCSCAVSGGLTGTVVTGKNLRVGSTNCTAFAIVAPSGTGTITLTYSGVVDRHACAILMSGADQTTPVASGDAVSASGITNPLSVTPANLTANDATVGIGANALGGDAPVWMATVDERINSNSTNVNAAGGDRIGTGAVSVTWGTPDTNDVLVAVRVAAAGGGGGPTAAQMAGIFAAELGGGVVIGRVDA